MIDWKGGGDFGLERVFGVPVNRGSEPLMFPVLVICISLSGHFGTVHQMSS